MTKKQQKKSTSKASAPKKVTKKISTRSAGRPGRNTLDISEADARQQLIKSSMELFAEKGFAGVATREIARKSGLNISLISYYFGGKLGLYQAVLRNHIMGFSEKLTSVVNRDQKAPMTAQVLRKHIETLINTIFHMVGDSEGRWMMDIMEREKIEGMPFAKEVHEEIVGPIAERLVDLLKDAQKQGIVRKDLNPNTFFILFFEAVFGYLSMDRCDLSFKRNALKPQQDKEELKNFILELFLKGISL